MSYNLNIKNTSVRRFFLPLFNIFRIAKTKEKRKVKRNKNKNNKKRTEIDVDAVINNLLNAKRILLWCKQNNIRTQNLNSQFSTVRCSKIVESWLDGNARKIIKEYTVQYSQALTRVSKIFFAHFPNHMSNDTIIYPGLREFKKKNIYFFINLRACNSTFFFLVFKKKEKSLRVSCKNLDRKS